MAEQEEETQAMTIRVPKETHEWLRRTAFEHHGTMNELVNDAITWYRDGTAWHDTEDPA